jgi:hypothetical protein
MLRRLAVESCSLRQRSARWIGEKGSTSAPIGADCDTLRHTYGARGIIHSL